MRELLARYSVVTFGLLALGAAALSGVVPAWDELGGWRWVTLVAAAVTAATLIAQDRKAQRLEPIVFPFQPTDWTPTGLPTGEVELVIPYQQHRRSAPTVEVQMVENGKLVPILIDQELLSGGDVRLVMGSPTAFAPQGISGRAIIR